ncbi:MAG: hypothetical protein DI539_12965 [Flavobacterium psychrophilum]|nr:MAG: hypothetical protein DI539_12965 [Flavobacterium psychrophilum]
MKKLILLAFLAMPSTGFSQRIKTADVLHTNDSIIKASVGEKLAAYFTPVASYSNHQNKKHTETFLRKKKLKPSATSINVLYDFKYPGVKGINGRTWIRLDGKLKLTELPEFNIVPNFLLKDESSNFISPENALTIIKEAFPSNVEIKGPELNFNYDLCSYTYRASRIITKATNERGESAGEMETLIIDAVTGEIFGRFRGYYGLIIH